MQFLNNLIVKTAGEILYVIISWEAILFTRRTMEMEVEILESTLYESINNLRKVQFQIIYYFRHLNANAINETCHIL